jgi:hypothetical protein
MSMKGEIVRELKAEYEEKMSLHKKIGSEVRAEIASKGVGSWERAGADSSDQRGCLHHVTAGGSP